MDIDAVLKGYADCALWSESCHGSVDHEDCLGDDCDASFQDLGYDDHSAILGGSWGKMRDDVSNFLALVEREHEGILDGLDPEQVGHDFWLTRNGHGAGFWDRGLGERGDILTKCAETYGEAWIEGRPDNRLAYMV